MIIIIYTPTIKIYGAGAVELAERHADLDMLRWPWCLFAGACGETKYLGKADAVIAVHATTDYQKAREMPGR